MTNVNQWNDSKISLLLIKTDNIVSFNISWCKLKWIKAILEHYSSKSQEIFVIIKVKNNIFCYRSSVGRRRINEAMNYEEN